MSNRVKGVTQLFTEPPDAGKPEIRWRLYVFKAGEALNELLYVHRQTSYLFGRERRVAAIPTDHPSCSKQHAVLQYREVEVEQADGMLAKKVRPYIMDLGSTNGTFINENRIEAERHYELMETRRHIHDIYSKPHKSRTTHGLKLVHTKCGSSSLLTRKLGCQKEYKSVVTFHNKD